MVRCNGKNSLNGTPDTQYNGTIEKVLDCFSVATIATYFTSILGVISFKDGCLDLLASLVRTIHLVRGIINILIFRGKRMELCLLKGVF